jgi:MFS family permease
MLLGWVTASIIGTRLLLTVGYRRLAIFGTSSLLIGSFLMSRADANINQYVLMFFVTLMGIGMGFSIPPFLIAVQTTVERRYLGTATSTLQFSRSIGGTLGVSVMGAALSARLISNLSASGMDLSIVDQLLDPISSSQTIIDESIRFAVANAINLVFVIALVAAFLAVIVTFFTPRKELTDKTVETEAVMLSAD